jgi:hypothetical protein
LTIIAPQREPESVAERRLSAANRRAGGWIGWAAAALLCAVHSLAIWVGMGGWPEISSRWPLAIHDHPIQFHSGVVTPQFLRASGTTAGYDPSFMAGYAKSIIFPPSSTMTDVLLTLFGRDHPAQVYKLCVLAAAALAPWLLAAAVGIWGARGRAAAISVGLLLIYLWTDFPINYVEFGMYPYFLAIPLGLATTAALSRFIESGALRWWLLGTLGAALVVLVHLTSAMIVVPAVLAAYVLAIIASRASRRPLPVRRHLAFWLIPLIVLAANAFWWLPGLWLASTKGPSDFAFSHPESVLKRLGQIFTSQNPIQVVLIGLGVPGFLALFRREPVAATALGGFVAAGFFWGYLAGALRALDFLQPGRHTYAFYSGVAVVAGIGLNEILVRIRANSRGIALGLVAGLLLLGVRLFGPALVGSVQGRLLRPQPFLSSQPSYRMLWVIDSVREYVKPGERLLYEEGGFSLPGVPDPFRSGRYSGLLPYLTGVEVLGGPYLHVALSTNFTQFGEGKLFGDRAWDRDQFARYAKLYRPVAIVCWSPKARAFCRAHPELIEVLDTLDLHQEGAILIGRVRGFEGTTIRGAAKVEAKPGRLVVSEISAELDGMTVLRYHLVPYLRSRPPVRLEPVLLEGDPVPFIGLRPTQGPLTLELDLPP